MPKLSLQEKRKRNGNNAQIYIVGLEEGNDMVLVRTFKVLEQR